MSEPVRWVIPAILLVGVLGVFFMLWRERSRPSSYPSSAAHRSALASVEDGSAPNLAAWRAMSTERQAAHDAAVLDAQDAAQAAAERAEGDAARWNSLYRP